ncbi:MAG: hypothetical protein ISR76_03340 [Planctomycetes bacterium]|nr:hypothetical protein [Planctomycetota bacterium]MBL7008004.1 hypothetical protein [Planctomycetota bacterium]
MEENIFPLPAVAGILENEMVEARLHNDDFDPEIKERVVALQLEMTSSYTTPIYLVLDPVTGEVLGRRDGALLEEAAFADFLRTAAAKKG